MRTQNWRAYVCSELSPGGHPFRTNSFTFPLGQLPFVKSMQSNDHHSDKEWVSFGIVSVHRGAAWQRHREPDTPLTTTSTVLLLASGDTVQTWQLVSPGPHVIVNWSLHFSYIFLVFTHDHIKSIIMPLEALSDSCVNLTCFWWPQQFRRAQIKDDTQCDVVLLVRWTVTLRSAILVLLSQDCAVHTDDSTLEHMKGGTVSMRGRQCPYITWNSVWEYLSILPNYFLFTHLFTLL